MRLLQDTNDPMSFIELIEYESQQDFELDQIRVQEDPDQVRLIQEWRELLAEPPIVEIWNDLGFNGWRYSHPCKCQDQNRENKEDDGE